MSEINMVPSLPSQIEEPPMSRTHQYRKVMKPLLERKRRARINKCLDDIKDLLIDSLQVRNYHMKTVTEAFHEKSLSFSSCNYIISLFYRRNQGNQ